MHKVKIKCKCLVSGFPAVKKDYEIGNFKLNYLKLDYNKFKINDNLKEFDLNGFLIYCQYVLESDGCHYVNYFESKDLLEIEVNNSEYKKNPK